MKYEFFEHTADKKFRAYGSTKEEAFTNAILATTAALFEPEKIIPVFNKDISIKADNFEQLLYDLIDELIFLMDTDLFITGKVEGLTIQNDKEIKLTATLEGDIVSNYDIGGDIKSPTYNQMEITDEYVQMVLDI